MSPADTNGRIGPAASWAALDAMIDLPEPAIRDGEADILFWYDGPQISIERMEESDDHFLRVHEVNSKRTVPDDREYPVWTRRIGHVLAFPNRDSILMTLHADFVPTPETYRMATSIQRVIQEWTLIEPHVACDMYETRVTMRIEDVPKDEMPDAHLVPGPETEAS